MDLDQEQLLDAYRCMRTIRMFEDRLHDEFATGQIPGFVHLYAGEEASAAGVIRHLHADETDTVASTHRGHGHSIAVGCDVKAMMKEIYGRKGGLCNAKGGSMHIADVSIGMLGANGIVGGGTSLSCGAALTAKVKKTGGVAVSFFGDGAFNQGMTLEAMNFARVYDLPVLFVLEDNGYAESTASSWSIGGGDPVQRAAGFGIRGEKVDGRDFFAVTHAAGEAIKAIRDGGGPRFIHIDFLRYYGHFEGDATTYRPKNEVRDERKYLDPLNLFRARVLQGEILSEDALNRIDDEVASLIDEAVDEAREAPAPDLSTLTTDVYVSY
ncbi:pyruvate dehydrogenase E1 component alpha subunit [Roseovarius pacificus]|uniref:Pyruvate dehydrogenase E1 component alpha subunit n=1 Tax=Roseovarius pacificus TaxID=337701 RepID=A0A1M6YV45_9RHOB|nr:thiamine pyrophosphate-dependent dehydrogenase E1 component subunit alpha [Roseovarius pacificus]GGO50348.1 dehydrogenase E1 component [Roseovarius pacificus]SHL21973.1 pyruvate dehydrogenase E1 component alpha subunit [Roseovarius pacificus]